jgi:hypothetical protein
MQLTSGFGIVILGARLQNQFVVGISIYYSISRVATMIIWQFHYRAGYIYLTISSGILIFIAVI